MDRFSPASESLDNSIRYTSGGYRSVQTKDQNVQETVDLSDVTVGSSNDEAITKIPRQKVGIVDILSDCALVTLPVGFIVFAYFVLRLDGQEVSESELSKWKNVIAALGTLFPILFASIVGRLLYEVARWKLERGATLGTLEQLLRSRTVGSTVVTQFQLRTMSLLTVGLLLIWVFSPLGAQAILRMLTVQLSIKRASATAVYWDPSSPSVLGSLMATTPTSYGSVRAQLNYLSNWYSALLLAPQITKLDTMDLWGNVKIPFSTLKDCGGNDCQDWSDVAQIAEPDGYSSFAGYSLANIPEGNSTFTMASSYLDLNCSKRQKDYWWTKNTFKSIVRPVSNSWADFTYRNGSMYGVNHDRPNATEIATWGIAIDRFVDEYWFNSSALHDRVGWDSYYQELFTRPLLFENETGIESKTANLAFEAQIYYDGSLQTGPFYSVVAKCKIKQRYVDSEIQCNKKDSTSRHTCSVTRQRPSPGKHASDNISLLSFPRIMDLVSWYWPLATGSSESGRADLSIQHLVDPKNDGINPSVDIAYFKNTSEPSFSRRLSQLLNTYLVLSQTNLATLGAAGDGADTLFLYNKTVPVEVGNVVPLYAVSKLWAVLCFLSCLVLLLSGILGVVFTHLAKGPEILGYASTVIRDSRLHDLPPEISGMMAMDITKAMRGERLRYGLSYMSVRGRRVLGVGREQDTERIADVVK